MIEQTQREFVDTLTNDIDSIILTIKASGVEPKIDSIKADWRKGRIVVTNNITNTVKEKKRFKDRLFIGPAVGVGYGLTSKKADVYVGITAGIKI